MRYRNLRVQDIMSTALVIARPDETMDSADFDMRLARVRHLPVVDYRNRLAGILSNRDVLRAIGKRGHKESLKVREVMSTDIISIRQTEPAHRAALLLMKHRIGCVPVEGEEGQLVGLVTESDFLEFAHRILLGIGEDETRGLDRDEDDDGDDGEQDDDVQYIG
jgi:CBS domain-containing protein